MDLPADYELRAPTPDDLDGVAEVLVADGLDDAQSFDRWAAEQTGNPSYEPSLWLLATAAGRPVGALTADVSGDRGWVDHLGVVRSSRGRGIGAALLLRAFAAFARRERRRVLLSVDADNPTGATRLYEGVEMGVVNRRDPWER
jgi:ribosomal protein S18 acetylase RimI-like enzyme